MLTSSNWLATLAARAASALLAAGLCGCSRPSAVGTAPSARAPHAAPWRAPGPQRAAPLPVTAHLSGKSYRCNLVVGPPRATAWFEGFERLVPDERWELLSSNDAFLETMGDPGARAWASPVRSPCADRAELPERVIAVAVSQKHATRDDWLTGLMTLVNAIRARYPGAREIQLSPAARGSTECGAGELADEELVSEAIDRVTQQFDGLVQPGARIRLPDCDSFEPGGLSLTPAGNARAARAFAEYYAGDL